jgi:hypothetical protein
MAIDLNALKVTEPERVRYETETMTGEVAAGKTLKIDTSPLGVEIAAGVVPVGKVWAYQIVVSIIERDA